MTTNLRNQGALGTAVTRIQGRPADIGRTGIVVAISAAVIGSAGDILVTVREANGGTFQCYDRQLKAIR